MKNYFLSAMMISISLLTFSCSNDDESTLPPDSNAKEVSVIEANSVNGQPGNVESEESSRYTLDPNASTCFSNGYGRTPFEAETNATNKFRIHPCYNPNRIIIFVVMPHPSRGWICTARHPGVIF